MHAPRYPLVSFITVNYIHLKDTIEFLESAERLTYPNIEIIVVDNGSPEGKPTEETKKRFPSVRFLESEKNLGFAGGNNLGIQIARGEFYFLLNNDTLLFPDFLEPIIAFMLAHPDAGMASPKVLYPDGKMLQFVGATGINPFTGRGKILGFMEEDNGQYDVCYKTDLGHGAALIVPRKVVDKVGLMPEVYFLYYEEHDWCEIVKRAGFSMYYIGTSKVLHKESVSTGSGSPLKTYYMTRNRLLFMRRNFQGFPFLFSLVFFFTISVPKNTAVYLFKGQFNLLKAFYRGIGWNLTSLIKMAVFNRIRYRIRNFRKRNPGITRMGLLAALIRGAYRVFLGKIYLRSCTSVGRFVSVNGKPKIGNLGEMYLGDEVTIWSNIEKAKLYTGEKGKLIVGRNTRLNGVHIDARMLIEIGENVRIGPYTVILDSDFHDVKDHFSEGISKPVVIEDNVWIATRATILKGVRIGAGAIIAAGAVVTRDVPPNSVAAGVPARVIKKIE